MKKKTGKPTPRELQTLGISTRYSQRFPPATAAERKPKPKARKGKPGLKPGDGGS